MLEIVHIDNKTLPALESAYRAFRTTAEAQYGWPLSAIDFKGLSNVFKHHMMSGYLVKDVAENNKTVGFLFYNLETFGALEIKVLYLAPGIEVKPALDVIFKRFIKDARSITGWEVISYPLLGPAQGQYIETISWYGFKPVGQAVVKFNILDGISTEVLRKQEFAPLPEGYKMVTWEPQHESGAIDVITEAFQHSVDSLWDPRFRTREGITEAITFVQSGNYGTFWPASTTVLLNAENKPIGVCFLNIISREEANIPLVGLLNSERQHKLGRTLLANTLKLCLNQIIKGQLALNRITATVATSNIPAVKMYRYTGFQEETWYPHVYQDRLSVENKKEGQWC